jgi:hypothetical protein
MAVGTRPESDAEAVHCLAGNLGWLLSQAHYALATELAAAFEPLGVSSRGLAERRPSTTDRRARVIAVTRAGRRKVAEGRAVVDRIQADVMAALPKAEREALLEGLGSLVQGRLSTPVECNPPLRRREPRA